MTLIVIVGALVTIALGSLIKIWLSTFLSSGVNEADPDDDALPVQRAKYFTGREMAELRSTATQPAIVAGADLDGSEQRIYNQAFRELVADLGELSEIEQTIAGYYLAPGEVTG